MPVKSITSKKQFDEILASDKVVFIDFYADWCVPCKSISPVFRQLAKENVNVEGAEFYQLDIDQVQDVAVELGIRSIPTFHAYKNKERIDMIIGANRMALTNLVQTSLGRL